MDSNVTPITDNFIHIIDEDGTDTAYESLGMIMMDDVFYAVVIPANFPEDEESDVVVLRMITEEGSGRITYIPVENEETADAVFAMFKEKYADDFDFGDEE